MTLWIAEVSGSMVTMPPLTRRGEIGDVVAILVFLGALLVRLNTHARERPLYGGPAPLVLLIFRAGAADGVEALSVQVIALMARRSCSGARWQCVMCGVTIARLTRFFQDPETSFSGPCSLSLSAV